MSRGSGSMGAQRPSGRPGSDPNAPRTPSGGLIRRAGPPSDSGHGATPPRRSARPNDTPPRASGYQPARGGRDDFDEDDGADSHSSWGRGAGGRARDFTRNMSRQLSAMLETARGAMRGRRDADNDSRDDSRMDSRANPRYDSRKDMRMDSGYGPSAQMGAMGPTTAETQALPAPDSYRRSRLRLRARKWRLGRHNPRAIWYAVGFALTAAVLVSLVGAGTGGAYYAFTYYSQHQADIAAVASSAELGSTTIYDRNGNVLYTVPKSTGVNIYLSYKQNDIGDNVMNATVATEDHTFWDATNIGIDWTSIFRSLLVDAGSGSASQGGSTITQQLVKNLVLHDTAKALQRKINEAILSVGITTSGVYPKWKILEMYLNTIDYSDGNLGIEAAAENYFGIQPIKDATKCGNQTFSKPRTCWANQ
ncbi:MAG TPA: transglycosylase domain-containing protein, partial [Ktedonobacterales bacterium]